MTARPDAPVGCCRYVLLVGDRWMSTSKCHYGQTIDWPVPDKRDTQARAS